MTSQRDPALVVIQLSGGNDALNTVVPYTNGIYQDSRTAIRLEEHEVLDLNGKLGLHPSMGPIKKPVGPRECRHCQRHRLSQAQTARTSDLWTSGTPLNR